MRAANPVLQRELVERWRGRRAVATMTAYLGVLGGILYLLYRVAVSVLDSQLRFGGGDLASAGPLLGRFLVEGLLFFVLLLVLFVSPGYAAAQLSGERERRTLPLLQITLMSPLQIVLGKLGASVAWMSLLVAAALPLGAAAFFLGGVSLGDLLRGISYVLVVAVGIAGMALGISSFTRRTTASIVLTYGAVLALVGGSFFVAIAEVVLAAREGDVTRPPVALYLNPFYGLADAASARYSDMGGFGGLPSPLALIAEALPESRAFERPPVPGAAELGPGGVVEVDPADRSHRSPVWLQVGGLYLALGVVGVATATRRIRTGGTVARLRGNGRRAGPRSPGASTPPEEPTA